jgi:hypothetical protein
MDLLGLIHGGEERLLARLALHGHSSDILYHASVSWGYEGREGWEDEHS